MKKKKKKIRGTSILGPGKVPGEPMVRDINKPLSEQAKIDKEEAKKAAPWMFPNIVIIEERKNDEAKKKKDSDEEKI